MLRQCGVGTGNLLQRKTVGIIGAGRIGTAYARMMMEVSNVFALPGNVDAFIHSQPGGGVMRSTFA